MEGTCRDSRLESRPTARSLHKPKVVPMNLEEIRSGDGTGTLTYFITDGKDGSSILIDPNLSDLQEICARIDRSGSRLQGIIDTHTHVDHTSAAGELHRRYGAPVIMHENTVHKWKVADQGD